MNKGTKWQVSGTFWLSVVDPHHIDGDPDPAFHFDADRDPIFHTDADRDPDPATHFFQI